MLGTQLEISLGSGTTRFEYNGNKNDIILTATSNTSTTTLSNLNLTNLAKLQKTINYGVQYVNRRPI